MNFSNLIGAIIVLSFIWSCNNEKDCYYENNNFIDSSFFVSHKTNGKEIKNLQIIEKAYLTGEHFKINDSLFADRIAFSVSFVDSIKAGLKQIDYSNVSYVLTFHYSKNRYSKQDSGYVIPIDILGSSSMQSGIIDNLPHKLSVAIGSYPSRYDHIQDTSSLIGFSLKCNRHNQNGNFEYSTNCLFEYFNYNKDSIQKYFNESYCVINKVEQVCNNYHLVQGYFSTKIMKKTSYLEKPEFVELKDIGFRFILK